MLVVSFWRAFAFIISHEFASVWIRHCHCPCLGGKIFWSPHIVYASRHDFIYLLLYRSCCTARQLVPWISRHSFVLKEFIRCFYIAGEFKVVDSMYVHWNFIFTADKVILYVVFISFSLSIWRYILSAVQIIPELGSICGCGVRHMWLYVMMGCHCYAFCFETRRAVCGSAQGSLALMGTDLFLLIDIVVSAHLLSRKKCKQLVV